MVAPLPRDARRALLQAILAAPNLPAVGHIVLDVVFGAERSPRPLTARIGDHARVLTLLRACVAALEAAGGDGDPGDMPTPALDDARAFLTAFDEARMT